MQLDSPSFVMPHIHKVGPDKFEATHGTDRELIVSFMMQPVHMEFKSGLEGRPIYEDQPHIEIRFPGDTKRVIVRPVKMVSDPLSPSDPERFPVAWERFKAQQEPAHNGTPLEEWPQIRKAQVFELKALHIHTVEQLASVPDSTLHNVGMGGRELRDKAKAWLDRAADGAGLSQVMSRLAALEAENEALKMRVGAAPEASATPAAATPEKDRSTRQPARKAA
jgi:hypothetical protein